MGRDTHTHTNTHIHTQYKQHIHTTLCMEINKAILRIQAHAGHTGQHTPDLKILLECSILLSTTENVKPGIQNMFQVAYIPYLITT